MHISITTSTVNGKTYRCKLLRETYVDAQGKRQKRTLANLNRLDDQAVELLKSHLAGHTLVPSARAFSILESRIHGPVLAVLQAFEHLQLPNLISSTASRARDLVCAMIAARIMRPSSKLATTRWWTSTTLAAHYDVVGVEVDELYDAMDWLLQRQRRIQGKLAKRLLADGDTVLYDVTSTYFEGAACELAKFGYSRDRKRGKLQLNFGLLCDRWGRPVSLSVHPGNVADSATLIAEMTRLQQQFSLSKMVLVGDRGMIVNAHLEALRQHTDFHWITALKSATIRRLQRNGFIDPNDARSLIELAHPDFPQERLMVCRNPALAKRRRQQRESLLLATEQALQRVHDAVARKALQGTADIGLAVGRCITRFHMKKHFICAFDDHAFSCARNAQSILEEQRLDGLYVIRTSLPKTQMSAGDTVLGYNSLCHVERAFRTLKTAHLQVRPIHHRLVERVTSHLFICMLAWYVEWHMREAWRPLTFADDELRDNRPKRDPVAPAPRSASALGKSQTKLLEDGTPAHSFQTLMQQLETITQNRCRMDGTPVEFMTTTQFNPLQNRALSRLDEIEQLRARAAS